MIAYFYDSGKPGRPFKITSDKTKWRKIFESKGGLDEVAIEDMIEDGCEFTMAKCKGLQKDLGDWFLTYDHQFYLIITKESAVVVQ